jgi:hypothetical protein
MLSRTSAPKNLLKALFVGTPLRRAIKNLRMSKAVPDGFKPQKCECRSGGVKPPIPYISEKDDLQEAVESSTSIKLTLPTRWSYGCQCGHVVPQRSLFCMSNKQSLPSKQKACKRPMTSLFGPRRIAPRSSRKQY